MKRYLVGAALGVLAAMALQADGAEPLKAGDTAPDFELEGSDGQKYKLSELTEEKTVVIAWYPKAFTGG